MIPDKLFIACQKERGYPAAQGDIIRVRPAFFVPATSDKMKKRARDWAHNKDDAGTTVENKVHTHIDIVNVEERAEGGRAIKVLLDGKYLVDLREDEFWDAFWEGRVDGSTHTISGKYVWVLNVTQMRLTTVGSEVYKKAEEAARLKALRANRTKLKVADLEVGKFYVNDPEKPVGGSWYLGRVRCEGKKMFAWREAGHPTKRNPDYPHVGYVDYDVVEPTNYIEITASIPTLYAEVKPPCDPPADLRQVYEVRGPGWYGRVLTADEWSWED